MITAALQCAAAGPAHTPAVKKSPAPSEKNDGAILVIRVTGVAYATGPGGAARTPLAKGARVVAGQTIITDKNASVMLVLSNGATLTIAGGSELAVEEFSQQPFAGTFRVTEISREPTASTTRLHLKRGEIISDVKKLNTEDGSSFSIKTPVGVAGIRGTAFRLGFREAREAQPLGPRRYGHVAQSSASGAGAKKRMMTFDLVMLEGEIETQVEGRAAPTSVPGEKQLRIDNIHFDSGTGGVDAASFASPMVRNASAADLAALRQAVQDMLAAAASAIISHGGEGGQDPGGDSAASAGPGMAPLPSAPGAQVPPPRLSPTDGE
ncbi:FecR family protein [Termitidicoccus mucosus]|uniref:FecR family protein n=1 Tax=Termitidicoccus mucosus TaxID=1184151 RepID=UPI002FEE5FDD